MFDNIYYFSDNNNCSLLPKVRFFYSPFYPKYTDKQIHPKQVFCEKKRPIFEVV